MCANIHYPEGKLILGTSVACVREHKCESFVSHTILTLL